MMSLLCVCARSELFTMMTAGLEELYQKSQIDVPRKDRNYKQVATGSSPRDPRLFCYLMP